MIIVEGCDGTGKTSLVNRISADLGLSVGQRGTPNRDELFKTTREDTYRALSHGVEGYHPPYIWDRLFFSEPIYSRVMGRDCEFSPHETMFIRDILKTMRCPIIICHIPLEDAQENMEKAHQMDSVAENFPFIHGMYEGLAASVVDWTHKFDYRVENAYEDLVSNVIQPYLTRRKDREWH